MKKLTIQKHSSTHNTTRCPNRTIKYIVIHYTAGLKSRAGKGKDVCDMWSESDRPGSADFVVDEGNIAWQYNPDLKNRKTWHCGGSLQGSGGHKYYKICTNANSIGIEMCSDKKVRTKELYSSDNDWYVTKETWKSAVALAATLLKRYNLPLSRMIRHYDVTGKECPSFACGSKKNVMYGNKTGEQIWKEFKQDVQDALDELNGKKKDKDDDVKTVTKVDKDKTNPTPQKDDSQVKSYVRGLQKSLNSLGEHLEVDGAYGAKTSAAMSRHNIKKGMKNDLVKHFQWWLKKVGIYKGEVDSSFGNQTVEAVKKFQTKVGITSDGIIGDGSAKAFMKLLK